MVASPARTRSLYLFYAVSGLIGLSYQTAWFRIFVDRFGSTNLTFVLVICNFIAGLGFGSLCSKWFTDRLGRLLSIRHALKLYGVIEILLLGGAALTLLAPLIPADLLGHFPYQLDGTIYRPVAARTVLQIAVATVCMFVPCFLMGTTFPMLCYAFRRRDRFPSALYAWNTLGACIGVLFMELLVIPQVGHRDGYLFIMAINLALGAYFIAFGGRYALDDDAPPEQAAVEPGAGGSSLAPASVLITCAVLSGLLSGAVEGDVFKRIWFVGCSSGPTMPFISFWAIIAIFLASWTVKSSKKLGLPHIKAAFALGFVAFLAAWHYRDQLMRSLSGRFAMSLSSGEEALQGGAQPFRGHYATFGDNPLGLLLFVGIFVFPIYFAISLLLPYVCNRLHLRQRHLGLAYGLNTVAFCIGMVAFAWIAPLVNIFYSLKLFVWTFAIGLATLMFIRETRPMMGWLIPVAAIGLAAVVTRVPSTFDKQMLSAGNLALHYPVTSLKSNGAHTSYVVNTGRGKLLYFDHHCMSATSPEAQRYMRLMAHFPLLAHPNPKTAMLICFGVGNTASAIVSHDSIERLDAVDLNDKVYETAPEFSRKNNKVYADPRVRLIHDDGRNFLALTDQKYDLITSEPPPPMQEGVYRLYTVEYYESVLNCLTADGLMTQWLPIEQMPPLAVEMAVSSFLRAFPHTLLFVGSSEQFILMGSLSPISLKNIESRFRASQRAYADLRALSLNRPAQVLGRVVQTDGQLRAAYADKPVLRDDRNDFRYIFHVIGRPAVIEYDPVAVLAALESESLESAQELRIALTDLARLKWLMPDFPDPSLMTVRNFSSGAVRHAEVDWARLGRLNFHASEETASKSYLKAAEKYLASLKLLPDQPVALFGLGRAQVRTGQLPAALLTFRRLLAVVPEDPLAHRSIATVLQRLNRHEEALAHLQTALGYAPDDPQTLALLQQYQRMRETSTD